MTFKKGERYVYGDYFVIEIVEVSEGHVEFKTSNEVLDYAKVIDEDELEMVTFFVNSNEHLIISNSLAKKRFKPYNDYLKATKLSKEVKKWLK